jgi:hypothetical protein
VRFSDLRQCLDLSISVLKHRPLSAIAIAIVIMRLVVKDGLMNGQRKIQNDQMTGAAAAPADAAAAADDENIGSCESETKNVSEMERNDRCDNDISF